MPRNDRDNDPLHRGCSTCGALTGQGCRDVFDELGARVSLVSFASRFVHKSRIEGASDAR